jgi:hypothetical protein
MRFLPLRLTLPVEGELLCCHRDFGKNIPSVNSDLLIAAASMALNFPKFDNWNF